MVKLSKGCVSINSSRRLKLGRNASRAKIKRPFRRIGTASYESALIGTLFGLRLCASSMWHARYVCCGVLRIQAACRGGSSRLVVYCAR